MKNIAVKILAAALLLTLVGCEAADATSSLVSSEDASVVEVSSEETSSEETSSEETSSEETSSVAEDYTAQLKKFIMADGYLDVQAASKEIKRKGNNDTIYFTEMEGVKGYEINGGIYWVDAETVRRLANTPCRGDGGIKWSGYKNWGSWSTAKDQQPTHAPAHLINDPLYMSMILPSERSCFLADRINASILDVASDKWVNVMTIGAIYTNRELELPDDAEFTICISDINLAVTTTRSRGWFEAVNVKVPKMTEQLYYLPWQLEHTLGTNKFPIYDKRITYFDDHVEIKLKGSDLNATEAKQTNESVKGCVYHFWGGKYQFDVDGSDVLGIVSSYKIWVKEPEWAEYLVASIGADWRDASQKPLQAFAGYKHAITTEPQMVIGHNIPTSKWDEIVGDESEKIQKIIGLK